jgi:superfamily II DNA/RNA helicase
VVLFSEWTSMLDQVEPLVAKVGMKYVRLDGSVPQKRRQTLVNRFQRDPDCRVFLSTNAGSTGLNLQAANTVINVDLPWNPAVLEQRIARAHRFGQTNPVHVYVLVTEQTLEEGLLGTLAAKKDLALAALDLESDVDRVDLQSGIEELKQRLEVLLGAVPEAPVDESGKADPGAAARRARVETAGGQLLTAAFSFLGELLPAAEGGEPAGPLADHLHHELTECLDRDEQGRPRLTVTLPDEEGLRRLAKSLAQIIAQSGLGSINH